MGKPFLMDVQITGILYALLLFNDTRMNISTAGRELLQDTRLKYLRLMAIYCKTVVGDKPLLFIKLLEKLVDLAEVVDITQEEMMRKNEMQNTYSNISTSVNNSLDEKTKIR